MSYDEFMPFMMKIAYIVLLKPEQHNIVTIWALERLRDGNICFSDKELIVQYIYKYAKGWECK